MKNEHDNTADVRLERTVSLRPCPFCALDSVERRQWEVGEDGRALYSEDFTHDVKLTIDGDWASDEQRMTYAEQLANVLNKQANAELSGSRKGA